QVLAKGLHHGPRPALVRGVADGAGGRPRELEVLGNRRRGVRRGPWREGRADREGEEGARRPHPRSPLSLTRKLNVGGPWPQRSTTSARMSTWGNTNHHSPPHAPRWSSGVDPVFIPSSAPNRWSPRRGSRSAWSHSAWPTSWVPRPSSSSRSR